MQTTTTTGTRVLDLYAHNARQLAEEARRLATEVAQALDRPAAHEAWQAAQQLDRLEDLLESIERPRPVARQR